MFGEKSVKGKTCKNCIAECTGAGKDGVATQCSYYKEGKMRMSRVIKIEIECCGDCPCYDLYRMRCKMGAEQEGELFYLDCPLEFEVRGIEERIEL